MNSKKNLLLVAIACGSICLAGCGKKKIGGENLIQIKAYNAGYGVEWLDEAIKQFKKAYPEYDVEVLETSTQIGTAYLNEIYQPTKNNTDLYFLTTAEVSEVIMGSYDALRTHKKTLLEDLTSVYNSPAIGANKKEESKTIAERMFSGYEDYCKYNGYMEEWKGKMYKLPWADGVLGIICNPSVLEKYDIEIPLTSNEFVAAVKKIYSHTDSDKIYPFSWAGSAAPGYWLYLYETWFTQSSGVEGYSNFMKCIPEEGEEFIGELGYKVYQDVGLKKALEPMVEICKPEYSHSDDIDAEHIDAQRELIEGKAAFMVTGDWTLNEMRFDSSYFSKTQNTIMLRTPILSSIGTDIGLADDTALHNLVKAIDEHKTDAEIKTLLGVNDAQIAKVREARATHGSLGVNHDMAIPSYADAKEAAKLFIKFLYSNDGCRIFRNKAYANLPLKYDKQAGDTTSKFQSSVDDIYDYDTVYTFGHEGELNDVRSLSNMRVFNDSRWSDPNTFASIINDQSQFGSKKYTADFIFTEEAKYMENNWASYMVLAGY